MLMTEINEERPPGARVEDYMTLSQAVRLSGYTEQYLRRIIKEGRIGAIKFGGHFFMVNRASLDQYLEQALALAERDKRFGPATRMNRR